MSAELQTVPPSEIAGIDLRAGVANAQTPEEKLMWINAAERMDGIIARKLFFKAITEFQRDCPIIEKGDKAYDKEYARMDRIWRTIRPLLARTGLSVSWQKCELKDGVCHIEGMLAHGAGHSIELVRDVAVPELLKGQNKAQQAGSASTYAQRYALCGALGIVTGEDDDGHAAGTQFVTYQQAEEIDGLLQACRGISAFDEKKFWAWAGATTTAEIPADKYAMARNALKDKLKGGVA
jgi:hypothetical protein